MLASGGSSPRQVAYLPRLVLARRKVAYSCRGCAVLAGLYVGDAFDDSRDETRRNDSIDIVSWVTHYLKRQRRVGASSQSGGRQSVTTQRLQHGRLKSGAVHTTVPPVSATSRLRAAAVVYDTVRSPTTTIYHPQVVAHSLHCALVPAVPARGEGALCVPAVNIVCCAVCYCACCSTRCH